MPSIITSAVIRQSAQDDATVQIAGDDLDVPEELAKMVDEDEEQEEINDSFMGRLQNMEMDFDTIKAKAQSTITEVKQAAEEKCVLMWDRIFCELFKWQVKQIE